MMFILIVILCFSKSQSATPRRSLAPCRTFLWDASSAGRYHLCKRLLRGRVYEGMGGKKFVRIKPNSVLEKLYPPSQHVGDRCLFCGHSFDNHLKSWWFPNLYSPFDQHLDKIYYTYTVDQNQNVISKKKARTHHHLPQNNQQTHSQKIKSNESKLALATQAETMDDGMRPMYNDSKQPFRTREFHKRYVEDMSNEIDPKKSKGTNSNSARSISNTKSTKNQERKSQNQNSRREWTQAQSENRKQKQALLPKYESRRIFDVRYRVPSINISDERHSFSSAVVLAITRTMTLERLDGLIWLQEREKRWHKWKLQRDT